jgi:hypothetical protein
MRRGDNIPSVADYAHWGEDAQAVWYAENRYDMEHADEIIEGDDYERDYEPDPFQDCFATEAEARAFAKKVEADDKNIGEWAGEWYVEHYDKKAHAAQLRKRQ